MTELPRVGDNPGVDMVPVVSQTVPLGTTRTVGAVPCGWSLLDIVRDLGFEGRPISVEIDGEIVQAEYWRLVRPRTGRTVLVRHLAHGQTGRLLAILAVVVAASLLAGPAAALLVGSPLGGFFGAISATTLLAITKGALTVAGILAVNSLAPRPETPLVSIPGGSVAYSLTGTSNAARLYSPVPVVFGKHRVFPALAAIPFTEIVGRDQYLRLLFTPGYAPMEVSDLRIGNTPIGQFSDVQTEFRVFNDTEIPLTLYTRDVNEVTVGAELEGSPFPGPFVTRTTDTGITQYSVDAVAPNGLYAVAQGGAVVGVNSTIRVEHRLLPAGGFVFAGDILLDGGGPGIVERSGLLVNVASGQYEVRLRYQINAVDGNPPIEAGSGVTRVGWAVLRSFRPQTPVAMTGVAKIAMRIRASDQLAGTLDAFNCLAEAYQPTFDGATWSAVPGSKTRNPAWAYAAVLRGPANKRPVADARIDGVALKAWADFCDAQTPPRRYDAILDTKATVRERLQSIAGAARASFAMLDGKYTVVRDEPKTTIIQHFTPRNAWGFKWGKTWIDRPHALKIRFNNDAADNQIDERIVYDDGFDALTATKFETMDHFGVSDTQNVFKDGRKWIAEAKLRSEIFRFFADVENIAVTRGDLARLSYDAILVGISWGRIKFRTLDGGGNLLSITVDEAFTMENGKTYAVRVRKSDSTSILSTLTTLLGERQTTMFLAVPIPAASPQPQVGDLYHFGESGLESIEVVIKGIQPHRDITAEIECVAHAPAIFASDVGVIPPFDPQVTAPRNQDEIPPDAPTVVSIISDDSVLNPDGSPRIVVTLGPPAAGTTPVGSYEAQFKASAASTWLRRPLFPGTAVAVDFVPVTQAVAYDLRVRALSHLGVPSTWTTILGHVVIGNANPPPDVAELYLTGSILNWPDVSPMPFDFDHYEIRHANGSNPFWGTATFLGDTVGTTFDVSGAPAGLRTFLVKAVDSGSNESVNAAFLIRDLGDQIVGNLILTQSEDPTFPGTKVNGTVSAGTLIADADAAPLFWTGDGLPFWSGVDTDPFWAVATYKAMSYTGTLLLNPDSIGSTLTLAETTVASSYVVEYRESGANPFWTGDGLPFWSGNDADPMWTPAGPFLPWPGSYFFAAPAEIQIRETTAAGPTQGVISNFDFNMDVPDILESHPNVAIAAGGSRIAPFASFNVIVNVTVDIQFTGSGAVSHEVVDKDPTLGALIRLRDAGGFTVAGNIDLDYQGY